MSRIHEALQRAEQDRQSQGQAQTPATAVARAMEVEAVQPLPVAVPAPATDLDELTFERLQPRIRQMVWKPDPLRLLTFGGQGPGAVLEEFRTLRARLYQMRGNMRLKKVCMASALPGEGKTFMAANLAATFVRQRGRRVLLVDADIRRPSQHEIFGAPQDPGLADYLKGDCDEFAIVQQGPLENLCFIAGGSVV